MTDDETTEEVPESYTVFGWATLGPSYQLRLEGDKSIDDVNMPDHVEALREDLRSRGFTDEQIEQMNIEIDQIVED